MEREEVTRINLCVIILEHSADNSSGDYNKELSYVINSKFFKRLDETENKSKVSYLYKNVN